MAPSLEIRDLHDAEAVALGRLMVEVYSGLEGFPSPAEQPGYYAMLANIGDFRRKPGARVLVAVTPTGELVGGVVYFDDMKEYGSGGAATTVADGAGIRLLGIDRKHRGAGAGKALTLRCIELARAAGKAQVVLHTTKAMQTAWAMYERLGFVRAEALDFQQQGFPVFGFRLELARSAA